jgi:sugar phosphate isomerase/epimerase
MQTAFHSVALDQLPVEEVMAMVARHGYDAIELNAETLPWAGPHITPETDQETRQRISSLAQDLGLGISAISAHVSLIDPDPAARADALRFTKGCIDLAGDLRASVVHGLSGPLAPGVEEAEAWEWLISAVAESANYANSRGVLFAFEAIANHLVSRTEDLQQLISRVGDNRLRVNFDPSHFEVMGDDPVAAARTLADRTVHVHLKDAQGVPEDFTFPPLGEGRIDFDSMIVALRDGGYDGVLSAEYEAQVYGFDLPPDRILADSHMFATRLIGLAIGRENNATQARA